MDDVFPASDSGNESHALSELEAANRREREALAQAEDRLLVTTVLLEAAKALNQSIDVASVLESLASLVRRAVGRSRVVVSTYDSEREELVIEAGSGGATLPVAARIPLDVLAPQVRLSIEQRRPIVVDYDDPAMPPYSRERAAKLDAKLSLSVPIILGEQVVGHIGLDEPGVRREFGEIEVQLLEGIAAQAAVALQNARLFEAQRETAHFATAMNRIDAMLHSSVDFQEVVRRALAEGGETLGADTAAILLVEDDHLVVSHLWRWSEEFIGGAVGFDLDTHGALALESGTPVVVEDATADDRVVSEYLAEYDIKSVVAIPLIVRGEPLGVLYFNWLEVPHAFSTAEVDFAGRIGSSVSLALGNSMLFADKAERMRYADALNRINAVVHSSLNIDEIMARAVGDAAKAAGFDAAAVHLKEGSRWRFAYGYGLPEDLTSVSMTASEMPLLRAIEDSGDALVIPDTCNHLLTEHDFFSRFDIGAMVAVPLLVRSETIGVLTAGGFGCSRKFTANQVEFMQQVGATMSLAMDNARLYEAEHDIAERLQEALLTMPDDVTGVEFAHSYHSATEAARVGGDFYDLFEMQGGRIGIVIGDVAGKGLDAAVLTSLVKNTIRAHANEQGGSPRKILELTNQVLYESTPIETFVTVLFAVLDCQDGHLVYSSAGHTEAAVLRTDGEVAKLKANGPILGGFLDVTFGQSETVLDPGETLFLYTDGLTEARYEGAQYGDGRLFGLLRSAHDSDPRSVIDTAVGDVVAYTKNRLNDDMAMLAVRRSDCPRTVPLQQRLDVGAVEAS